MAKKKNAPAHKKKPVRRRPQITPEIAHIVREVEQLMDEENWETAALLLLELNERLPDEPAVLGPLAAAFDHLGMLDKYQWTLERLVALAPDEPWPAFDLVRVYAVNHLPALALRNGYRVLATWPNEEETGAIRDLVVQIDKIIPEYSRELGVSEEDGFEVAVADEEIQCHIAQGNYVRGKQLARAVLRRHPQVTHIRNNLSLILFYEGNHQQALAEGHRALEQTPNDIYALSNLIRYLRIDGQVEEAGEYAARLKSASARFADEWMNMAKGLMFAEDYEGVLETGRQANQRKLKEPPYEASQIYHLTGVAAAELGRESEAQQWWQFALKVNPEHVPAYENLQDAGQPVGERNGPFPFGAEHWIPPAILEALDSALDEAHECSSNDQPERIVRRVLRRYPPLQHIAREWLQRGDSECRELAIDLIGFAEVPELMDALKTFALGQRGTDSDRQWAADLLNDAGLLPDEPVRLWRNGAWVDWE